MGNFETESIEVCADPETKKNIKLLNSVNEKLKSLDKQYAEVKRKLSHKKITDVKKKELEADLVSINQEFKFNVLRRNNLQEKIY